MRLHSKYTLPSFDPSALFTSCVYATSESPSFGGSWTCARAGALHNGGPASLYFPCVSRRAYGHVEVLQLDELRLAVVDDVRAARQQRADQRVLRANKTPLEGMGYL